MRIERFQLQGFAQHRDLDLSFRDGEPNLIIGPNEAGKSHLMRGLLGTLYGIPNPGPYIPWHGEPLMTGWLRFTVGDDVIDIERRFLEQKAEVWINDISVYTGRGLMERNTAEDERYHQLLYEWLGFSEPKVFERTVFVGQDLLMDEDLGDFSSQIKRVITGTQEANYDTAIRDLERELDQLKLTGMARKPRKLEQLQQQLKELEERHRQAEQVQIQVVALVDEERTLNESIETASSTQKQYKALVDRYGELQRYKTEESNARQNWSDLRVQIDRMNQATQRRTEQEQNRDRLRIPGDPAPEMISNLNREIERVQTRIQNVQQAVERDEDLRKTRAKLEAELEQHRVPEDLDPEEVQALGWQIQQAEYQVSERRRDLETAENVPEPASSSTQSGLRTTMMVSAAVVMVASVGLGVVIDPILFAGVLLAAVLLAIPFLLPQGSGSAQSEARDEYASRIARCREELEQATTRLNELISRREELLTAAGVATIDELHQQVSNFRQAQVRLDAQPEFDDSSARDLAEARVQLGELERQRDELLRASGEQDLDTLYRRANEYRETLRLLETIEPLDEHQMRELHARIGDAEQNAAIAKRNHDDLLQEHPELESIPAESIDAYRRAVQDAETSQQSAERRLHEVRYERQQLGRGSENAESLRLEIEELKEEIERIKLLADAHELAIKTLKESVREFQENALDPVAEHAARYFTSITDGRYDGVELDRDRMTPAVSGNGQRDIDYARLSRGAKDQLYLSIRAALVDALSGDRNLPLVLDDPCVHFDDGRLKAAADLISQLSNERQILLFTKDETWTRWFDPVLRLQRHDASTPVS